MAFLAAFNGYRVPLALRLGLRSASSIHWSGSWSNGFGRLTAGLSFEVSSSLSSRYLRVRASRTSVSESGGGYRRRRHQEEVGPVFHDGWAARGGPAEEGSAKASGRGTHRFHSFRLALRSLE